MPFWGRPGGGKKKMGSGLGLTEVEGRWRVAIGGGGGHAARESGHEYTIIVSIMRQRVSLVFFFFFFSRANRGVKFIIRAAPSLWRE